MIKKGDLVIVKNSREPISGCIMQVVDVQHTIDNVTVRNFDGRLYGGPQEAFAEDYAATPRGLLLPVAWGTCPWRPKSVRQPKPPRGESQP